MARSARPDILADWAACLVRHGLAADIAHATTLELEQIAASKGVSIDRLRPAEDPAANQEWRGPELDRLIAQRGDTPDLTDVRNRIDAARRRFETAYAAAMQDDQEQP